MIEEINIKDIKVVDRIRQDMGDIKGLAKSIREVGLLNPVGIDGKNHLICGERRLFAVKSLGWGTIPYIRLLDLDHAVDRLKAERDENEHRKPFTLEESLELGRRLESLERPKAAERKLAGRKTTAAPCTNLVEGSGGKGSTNQKVAKAIGMSPEKYRQAKFVSDAAAAPDAAPEIVKANAEMLRTGRVNPAYKTAHALRIMPRVPGQVGTPFDRDAAVIKFRDGIKKMVKSWPDWARSDIPTMLRRLAKEDWYEG